MKNFLLILIIFPIVLIADFSRTNMGVVIDSNTGLEWQDNYNDTGGNIKTATWQDAINYCESLTFDDGGWRLPNIRELISICDFSQVNPLINPIFQYTTNSGYWSSTTVSGDFGSDEAWSVDFVLGLMHNSFKKDYNHIRCVRDAE